MRILITSFLMIVCIPSLGTSEEFKIPNKFKAKEEIMAKKFNENYEYIENQMRKLNKILEENKIPKGTVAAFSLPECPIGWSSFDDGAGRVIIGVGKGEGLEPRFLKQTGGAETHTLTIAEMPRHTHGWLKGNTPDDKGSGGGPPEYAIYDKNRATTPNPIDYTGSNQPHNNMPPFVALRFCQKD